MLLITMWKYLTIESWHWCPGTIEDMALLSIQIMMGLIFTPIIFILDILMFPIEIFIFIKKALEK